MCIGRRGNALCRSRRVVSRASRTPLSARADADRARAYDAWYETGLGAAAHQIELRLVAELAAPVPGERALDVGCGTGIYTAWLAAPGLDVAGLDPRPAAPP